MPDGRRLSKTVDGVTTSHIWDGSNIVADTTNGITTKFIRSNKLEQLVFEDTTLNYKQSIHGDIINSGDAEYTYDAFGNLETEAIPYPFGYCGEYFDEETGFVYLRNRYYNPTIGRFTQEDPIRDGLNWYAYCENNPIAFVDPLGLFGENTILQIGSYSNPDVVKLQRTLNNLGYVGKDGKKLDIDGHFGSNTEYTVKQFQTNSKGVLEIDGIVGKKTWKELGLEFDYSFEHTRVKKGIPELYFEAFSIGDDYTTFYALDGNLGLSTELSFAKVGGEIQNRAWNVGVGNLEGSAAIGISGIEFGAEASAINLEAEFFLPSSNGKKGFRGKLSGLSIGGKLDATFDGTLGFSLAYGIGAGIEYFWER